MVFKKKVELPSVPHDAGEEGWRIDAACKEGDNWEAFFHPDQQRGNARKRLAERAIAICKGCTVMDECRDYAITTGQEYGIWGGMTQEELRKKTSEYKNMLIARQDNRAS